MSEATPTLEEVLDDAIQDALLSVYTNMPGMIESYDPAKQMATIRLSIKRTSSDGVVSDRPLIENVPVIFPRGKKSSMTWPLIKGDPMTVVFSMRSLDVWKSKGGSVDPMDTRKFHVTDAMAIPGGASKVNPIAGASAENVRFVNDKAVIEMLPAGKFKITNGTNELIDLVVQLTQALIDAKTITPAGPTPFWGQTQATLAELKAKVETLKG